jgi:DNA-binding GntR family transcriptional regulator
VDSARPSTREYVASYIRERIFSGEFPPRSRVPQDEIAAAVGMSRIPVREALVALEAEGYVTMPTNRGAFVQPFSAVDLLAQFELRGYAFGLAARRAASSSNEALIETLTAIERAARETHNAGDFLPLMRRFNEAIVHAGASPRLHSALSRFRNVVPGNFYAVVPGAVEAARSGLRAEVRAQRRRDPELALRSSVASSLAQGRALIAFLDERGQLSPDDESADGAQRA